MQYCSCNKSCKLFIRGMKFVHAMTRIIHYVTGETWLMYKNMYLCNVQEFVLSKRNIKNKIG